MKRLLVVSADRDLTRFVAETLVGRSLDAFVPHPDDPWDVARAHTGLEAEVLVTRGRRRFHAIVIDGTLPHTSSLDLVDRLRRTDRAASTPVFLVVDRGREPHARRIAAERLHIAGFLERPLSERGLTFALELLERPRRLLVVDPDPERARRYGARCEERDFEAIIASTPEGALKAVHGFQPDVAAVALAVDSHGGLGVCAEIKRARAEPVTPVLLYGHLAALPRGEIRDNPLRADDFVPAPFDDEVLVERIIALVGYGNVGASSPGSDSEDEPLPESQDLPTSPGKIVSTSRSPSEAPAARPVSKPAPPLPAHRQTRRVPCSTSLRVQDGDVVLESRTLDISPGGIYFEMEPPLDRGTMVDLTFQMPDRDKPVHAVGRVAWAGPGGVGVKFTRIDRDDLVAIVDYVNRVSKVLFTPNA